MKLGSTTDETKDYKGRHAESTLLNPLLQFGRRLGFLVGCNRKGQEVEHIQQSMHTNTMVRHLLPGDVQAVVRQSRCHLGNLIKLLVD